MRHDIVCILNRAIDAWIGEHHAGHTADRKQKDETNCPQAAVFEMSIEPPHIVAIQENILMPVGTAITMLAKRK